MNPFPKVPSATTDSNPRFQPRVAGRRVTILQTQTNKSKENLVMKTNPFPWERRRPRRRAARSETERNSPARMPALPGKGAHGARTVPRSLSRRFALLAAAALLTHAALAAKPPPPPPPPPPSSGTLVLDFQYPAGDYTDNEGLTVAPSGTIYASGYGNGGGWRGIVLASSDGGGSWFLVDDY